MADIRDAARELGRRGGYARSDRMSSGQRKESAIKAAKARWGEVRKRPCALCGRTLGAGKLRYGGGNTITHDRPFCDEIAHEGAA